MAYATLSANPRYSIEVQIKFKIYVNNNVSLTCL